MYCPVQRDTTLRIITKTRGHDSPAPFTVQRDHSAIVYSREHIFLSDSRKFGLLFTAE
jgi:CRISPR/Cas system-associated exonuclease Cas4 (RecB family)